jgi:hypothetical protein
LSFFRELYLATFDGIFEDPQHLPECVVRVKPPLVSELRVTITRAMHTSVTLQASASFPVTTRTGHFPCVVNRTHTIVRGAIHWVKALENSLLVALNAQVEVFRQQTLTAVTTHETVDEVGVAELTKVGSKGVDLGKFVSLGRGSVDSAGADFSIVRICWASSARV